MRELAALIRAAQAGEQDAFAELVERFQGMAIRLVTERLPDADLAQDIVQEAWLDAYLSLASLRIPAAFSAWFRRILIKHCDRHLRKRHLACVGFDGALALPSTQPDGLALLLQHEQQDRLWGILHDLPAALRDIAIRFYVADETQQRIAAQLGLPLTTVKKRLSLVRRRIGVAFLAPELDASVRLPQTLGTWTVPFWLALWSGDADRVQQLLRLDPALVQQREQVVPALTQRLWLDLTPGFTPLHRAVAHQDRTLSQILLNAGADCNAATPSGITPLHIAVLHDAADLVRLLLAAGASARALTTSDMTPLHWAARWPHTRVAALLTHAGAALDVPDRHGQTPRQWAQLSHARARHSRPQPSLSGYAALGRVLGPDGVPLDGLGVCTPATQPVCPGPSANAHPILEIGIKAIDLFAPIRRGGVIAVQAAPRVGQLVLLCELMHRLIQRYQGCAVVLSYTEHAIASQRFVQAVQTSGLAADVAVIVCPREASQAEQSRCVAYGHALAVALATQREVFLFVEQGLVQTPSAWATLTKRPAVRMTTLLYSLDTPIAASPVLPQLDGQIALSAPLARRGVYPAIDPHRSFSALLQERIVAAPHRELVAQIRHIVKRQRDNSPRCERLQWFQSQPFFVAEPFTARMGQDVGMQTTLHDYATILAGGMDALPLAALHFTGSLAGV